MVDFGDGEKVTAVVARLLRKTPMLEEVKMWILGVAFVLMARQQPCSASVDKEGANALHVPSFTQRSRKGR